MIHAVPLTNAEPLAVGDRGVISELLGDALQLFDDDRAVARRLVEQALTLTDRAMRPIPFLQGGFASWQMRLIETHIDKNLNGSIRMDSVAGLVSLSQSYFSRAFKTTFGTTFSQYVIRRRIALAKQMLLTTDTPIAEIALDCGLADQSHLTRLFKRTVGAPPNAWRRAARCNALPAEPRALEVYQAPADGHRDGVGAVAYA